MIPTATLRIEAAAVNPPKPLGFMVLVDGKPVAVLTLDEVNRAHEQVAVMQARRAD